MKNIRLPILCLLLGLAIVLGSFAYATLHDQSGVEIGGKAAEYTATPSATATETPTSTETSTPTLEETATETPTPTDTEEVVDLVAPIEEMPEVATETPAPLPDVPEVPVVEETATASP
jgi:hypothetical protein